jgi:hypothetical protein
MLNISYRSSNQAAHKQQCCIALKRAESVTCVTKYQSEFEQCRSKPTHVRTGWRRAGEV